jgi:hypothetical protein
MRTGLDGSVTIIPPAAPSACIRLLLLCRNLHNTWWGSPAHTESLPTNAAAAAASAPCTGTSDVLQMLVKLNGHAADAEQM